MKFYHWLVTLYLIIKISSLQWLQSSATFSSSLLKKCTGWFLAKKGTGGNHEWHSLNEGSLKTYKLTVPYSDQGIPWYWVIWCCLTTTFSGTCWVSSILSGSFSLFSPRSFLSFFFFFLNRFCQNVSIFSMLSVRSAGLELLSPAPPCSSYMSRHLLLSRYKPPSTGDLFPFFKYIQYQHAFLPTFFYRNMGDIYI